jgi:heterodisulfide reductase subunit A
MRAAIELAEAGADVYLIEREHFVGGRVSQWDNLFTSTDFHDFNSPYQSNIQ